MVVAGVPICPEWSLDHYHRLEVGFGNVSPWLDKEERWLGAKWQAQGLNYSMHELDSREPRVVLPDTNVLEKNMPPHLKALDPVPRRCVFWFVGWMSPVATTSVDTLLRGRDRTSSNWLKSAG